MTKIKSFNINHIALLGLLVGSTFQYGDFIVSRWFVPFVCTLFGWLILSISMRRLNKYQFQLLMTHALFFVLFILLSFLGGGSADEFGFDFVKLFLSFSISFLVFYFISKVDINTVNKYLLLMLYFSILFLFLEVYFRFQASAFDFTRLLQGSFYYLKFGSPFMVDSNAVALYAFFYMLVSLYLIKHPGFKYKLQVFLLFCFFVFFIALTFSRSVYVASLIIILIIYYNSFSQRARLILFFIFFVSLIFIIFNVYNFVMMDGSGKTKLGVIENILNIAPDLDFRGFLFGYGINEGNYIYSYEKGAYSHLLFPMVLGQFGLVGLMLYLVFFYLIYLYTKKYVFMFLLGLFVIGLSYLHPFLESVFLVNGILLGMYYHKNNLYPRIHYE